MRVVGKIHELQNSTDSRPFPRSCHQQQGTSTVKRSLRSFPIFSHIALLQGFAVARKPAVMASLLVHIRHAIIGFVPDICAEFATESVSGILGDNQSQALPAYPLPLSSS